jgi:hypothetical protein
MSFFEGLTSAWIKRRADGKAVFFPYGKLGSGYVLSRESEVRIRKLLRIECMVSLPIVVLSGTLFGPYALVLLPILCASYITKVRRLLAKEERTNETMGWEEVRRNMASSMGVPTSIAMLLLSLLMTCASLFAYFTSQAKRVGFIGVIFFGLCLWLSALFVKGSMRRRKTAKRSGNAKGRS